MDNRKPRSYLGAMSSRLIALIAVVFLVAATSHAAGMRAFVVEGGHDDGMSISAMQGDMDCDGQRHCMAGNADLCVLICAGPAGIPPAKYPVVPACTGVLHDLPAATIASDHQPGLQDRPPRFRLL